MDSLIDWKKSFKKTPSSCKNKQDYIGGTNDKTRESGDSPSDNDGCAIKLVNEYKNEEDDKYIEPPSEENDIIKSKISEGITEEDVTISLSAKNNSRKVIQAVMFTIDNH